MPAKGAPVLTEDERSSLERFKEAYEQAIISAQDTSRSVESDGFHPSALGTYMGKCARRDVYLLRGIRKQGNFSPRTLRVFANGHSVHDRIQSTIGTMGVDFEAEVEIVYDDPPVRGHADGIITWEGKRILLEIKSIGQDGFANRKKWKKPKPEHYAQANIYAFILGIDTIWVFYENKNDQDDQVFEVKADYEAAEKQLKKWRKTYETFENGEIPKRPYKPDSQACLACDVRYHCLADEEMGV